ncbi:hypothetical protein QRD90_18255 [Peribacillus frigoritolerans]|nr:hypothetical protein [Peribacillus frigoritolerans]WJE46157.1 hypothetical protein QRD90_18255 [Peribacillus frigoritolerans]
MSSKKNANLELLKWAAMGGVFRAELNDKFEKIAENVEKATLR